MLKQKMGAVDLTELALGIVILGIIVSIGSTVLLNVRDTNTVNNTAYNLTDKAGIGLAEYGNWFKILVIVGVAAVILGLIFSAFGRAGRQGGASY